MPLTGVHYEPLVVLVNVLFLAAEGANNNSEMSVNLADSGGSQDVDQVILQVAGRSSLVWLLSILSTCAVGLSGIIPLFIISPEMGAKLSQNGEAGSSLRLLLGFAVGGLLGDVFLHLLPESWEQLQLAGYDPHSAHQWIGMWVLLGVFTFVLVELIFAAHHRNQLLALQEKQNCYKKTDGDPSQQQKDIIHISGYLNLLANGIDNFSHGLAVAGSFIAGTKFGLITTFAILIHEIPHEVGDFAILLKSGFTRWQAARAQLTTASIGVMGAIAALSVEQVESLGSCTSWILPFTSGGFLNIALIGVLPELLKEENPRESAKQLLCILAGVGMMAFVQQVTH